MVIAGYMMVKHYGKPKKKKTNLIFRNIKSNFSFQFLFAKNSWSLNSMAACFIALGTLFDIGVWYHVKDLKVYDDDETDVTEMQPFTTAIADQSKVVEKPT